LKVDDALARMEKCLASAHLLHAEADYDGTCNRAYYAMYNATRAALIAIGEEKAAGAKTHHGLHTSFAELLVRRGLLPKSMGTQLTDVERRRLIADYVGDGASPEDATVAIESAATFVAAMKAFIEGLRSKK
jgi:uncharacterized protein (UPF0332 family)